MITIPSPNPVQNSAFVSFDYTVNPSTTISSQVTTNIVGTQINAADIDLDKYASTSIAKLDDLIIYTIVLNNYGNVTASSIFIVDTIPNGLAYEVGTLELDSVPIPGDPNVGISIPDMAGYSTSTLVFTVKVVSLPNPSSIANQAMGQFEFLVDPSLPVVQESVISNTTQGNVYEAIINGPDGGFTKLSTPSYTDIGDTITYIAIISNTGNVTADNVVFTDTQPNGTMFIPNSVTINGLAQPGADPNPPSGVTLGQLPPGVVTTLTFNVLVYTLPTINPVQNSANALFAFVIDPSLPVVVGSGNSTSTSTQVNSANFITSGITTYVDKDFAKVGDILNYTVVIENTGNTTALNSFVVDSIPGGTTFVADSLTFDGILMPGQSIAPPSGYSAGNLIPGVVSTITYQLLVNTIPTINPIPVESIINYQYVVDPMQPLKDGGNISNMVYTTINQAIIDNSVGGGFNKFVSKAYVSTGDIITYTLVIKNTGNADATNVVITDTVPANTTFIPNSVTLNGAAQVGADPNPPTGINVGTIAAGSVSTLTFDVQVTTIPTSTPIVNSATTTYDFAVIPTIPNSGTGSGNTNPTSTSINVATIDFANGGFNKYSSEEYADLNDQITYTIVLKNTGNVSATNVVLVDTIAYGLTFVPNTVQIIDLIPGADPNVGINVGTISPNQTITVSFLVTVSTIPTINPIPNSAAVNFNYTADPSIPNGNSGNGSSDTISTQVNNANFSEALGGLLKISSPDYCKIGDTITYTIIAKNAGNVDAINTVVVDTIPTNTVFVNNSLILNGVLQSGATVEPPTGFSLGTVPSNSTSTITFDVVVVSLPASNPVLNTVYIGYDYTTDPSVPNGKHGGDSATGGNSEVNMAIIDSTNGYTKYVDKDYSSIRKNLTYTIAIKNSGNVTATNVVLLDTMPYGIIFVPGSVDINNINVASANPTVAPGAVIGDIPGGSTSTVSFKVLVTTTPSPNPVTNSALVNFDYTMNPLVIDGESAASNSNSADTLINSAIFAGFDGVFPSTVNEELNIYSSINEVLEYGMYFTNIGNVPATNVIFTNTIPVPTTFIPNSVTINGITIPGANPDPSIGVNLGTILPDSKTTITFQVLINSNSQNSMALNTQQMSAYSIMPTTLIVNSGILNYNFTEDPLNVNGATGRDVSNDTTVQLNYAEIQGNDFTKYQSKSFSEVGDTITYSIVVTNTGTTTADNVMVYDTIPAGSQFIAGSVVVNNMPTVENPQTGISLGSIAPNYPNTVSFIVEVVSVPSGGAIDNQAMVNYSWIVDPTIGNTVVASNLSNSTSNSAYEAILNATKISSPDYADLGSTLTYSIILNNAGNVTLSNIVIVDTIPSNVIYVNDSLTLNGSVQPGADPTVGFNIGGLIPTATATVQFMVNVVSLPVNNPTSNTLFGNYNYIVDPSLPAKTGSFETTSNGTQINNANFNPNNGGFTKYVNNQFATLGDTLTYTIVLLNNGNMPAQNTILTDTVPVGTEYISGSVLINNVSSSDEIPTGVSLGTIYPSIPKTVSYKVKVVSATPDYYINNTANVNYVYAVNPTEAPKEGNNMSTMASTYEKIPSLTITSTVSKNKATVGEKIVYVTTIKNTGNTEAENVVVCLTLANGLSYVSNSTTVAGIPHPGESLVDCITIPNLGPNSTITLSFCAQVVSIPRGGLAINDVNVGYSYIVDPSMPANTGTATGQTPPVLLYYNFNNDKLIPINSNCNTNSGGPKNLMDLINTSPNLNCANSLKRPKQYRVLGLCSGDEYICVNQEIIKYKMWQQHNIDSTIVLPEYSHSIDSIEANVTIIRSDRIKTPDTEQCSNLEGKKLSGNKQIVEALIKYTIKFINSQGNLCSKDYYKLISSFIVISHEYEDSDLEVKYCVEDININKICCNEITLSTSLLFFLVEKTTADSDCSDYKEANISYIANSNIGGCNLLTFISPCHRCWNEFNVYTQELTGRDDMGELVSVTGFVSSLEFEDISTPVSNVSSNEGLSLTGNILLISMTIDIKLTYVSNDGSNSLRQIGFVIPASSYIVVEAIDAYTFCASNKYDVDVCLEDIYICNLDGNSVFTNTTILIKAEEYVPLPLNCRKS